MSLGRSLPRAIVSACDDIDILPTPDDFEAFQLEISVGGAFTGLEVVFVPMPWADEVHFIAGKLLAKPAAIGADHFLDFMHHDAFAGGPALVHTEVLISVEL